MNPSRPVIAFALLRQCGDAMHTDLLGGVAVLMKPLVVDLVGQVYDARVLADRMAAAYGIAVPMSALEDLTGRLIQAGILVMDGPASGVRRAVYSEAVTEGIAEVPDEAEFQHILDDFLAHSELLMKSANIEISAEKLEAGFLRRLSTLDFSSIRARPIILEAPSAHTLIGPAAREAQLLSASLSADAAIDALVATYIANLQTKRPHWLKLLSEVADGALGLELVLDLQAPTSVPRLTDTTAVIDTPLLLSFLDLSSRAQHVAAVELIQQLMQSGAKIAAFQHSIEEAESVLQAIETKRQAGEAYGPTVARMSSASYRAFFDTMRGKIAWNWQHKHNFSLIQEAPNHFYKNFSADDEAELTQRIRTSIVDRYLTSERDAGSVAETMRRLGGAHIPVANVAACKFIFVTGNTSVQRRAAEFLREKGLVRRGEFVPVVTDRYVAGLCWLISGGRSENSPNTARLLANCAGALRSKKELIIRTKQFLLDLDETKAMHFEALMTNERASQYLVELTLGNPEVITANNVDEIFHEAQLRAAAEVAKERDEFYGTQIAQIAAESQEKDTKVEELQERLREVELDNSLKEMVTEKLESNAEKLTNQVREQQESITSQNEKIRVMDLAVNALSREAGDAKAEVTRRQDVARKIAYRFADRRVQFLRFGGVLIFAMTTLALLLIDKFALPNVEARYQYAANIGFIFGQMIFAVLTGVSFISDKLFAVRVDAWRDSMYREKLAELGY